MPFDSKDFRKALSKFPTGVTIITTRDSSGNPVGMTASSFNSLSIDPALVLWSIDKNAFGLEYYKNSKYFAINILSAGQVETSNKFARRGEDKFSNTDIFDDDYGSPIIKENIAWFQCKTWNVYEGGDHFIIIGEVKKYSYRDDDSSLVFYNGHYAKLDEFPSVPKNDFSSNKFGVLSDYFLFQLRQTLNAFAFDLYPRFMEFGVSEDEWRVLTLLSDGLPLDPEKISNLVPQPIDEFYYTVESLRDKDLLVFINENRYQLTGKGILLASKMLDAAIKHEKKILSCLTDKEQILLMSFLNSVQNNISVKS